MTTSTISPWIRNKSDELAVDRGCYFDLEAAERVRFFFERFLRHSKGEFAGQRFTLLDWQWDRLIAPAYGWKMPDGTRRFRRVGCAVPKKNGKSTLLSGIAIYMLCGDCEPGAEVYSAAADREQASIIFNEAANMVEASDALARHLKVKRTLKTIAYPKGAGHYKALSSEVGTKEGLNISCLLFDELHTQVTRDLWNALRYGGAARRQPMLWWITTAGFDIESLCYEEWQRAKAIQESREVDISYLACIYETDEEADDWTKEETWKKANPSYGITINPREFAEAVEEAKAVPSNENTFRRYRLNQWTKQQTRWIPQARWLQCIVPYKADELRKHECILGLDLATTTDLNAAVAVFKKDGRYRVLPFFWIPANTLRNRERENRTRLDAWVRQGFIKATEGDVVDYGVIRKDIGNLADRFKIKEIAIDPWNATQLATDLAGDGFAVEYVRTGFLSISAATKEFQKLVLARTIEHNNNPVLNWNLGNIAVETDASGNLKPSKKKSAEKIDGIVALILALAKYISEPPKKPSVYQNRGVLNVQTRKPAVQTKADSETGPEE